MNNICVIFLIFICSVISGYDCFTWDDSLVDGQTLHAYVGNDVNISWAYTLGPQETVTSTEWFFQGRSHEMVAISSPGYFVVLPTFSRRVQQTTNGGLSISHVTTWDSGNYSVEINGYNAVGQSLTERKHVELVVEASTTATSTSTTASRYDCDFEDGFCSWTNTKDDNFDWLRHSGTTPTAATGPSVDHTLGIQYGQYAYIETSSPRANHDTARLQSALLNPQQEYCLSFWYHMYGANLGDINVRISSNGITGAPMQTLVGPSEDKWKQDFYTIHPQSTPFRIVIEGVSGPGYQGDAAIDDITVTENACP